jgi:hypothetical protein
MIINIDWLQLNCRGVINASNSTHLRSLGYQTRQFKCIEEYYIDNDRIATITHTPLSSILEATMVLVKFDNWVLYSNSLWDYVNKVISSLGLSIVGVSRLDICCDFNTFTNRLSPQKLINRFFTCKYRKVGQCKFRANGEQKTSVEYDYIRFGTNNSQVSAYLYNKTKELNEAKYKPYIVETWKSGGLDTNKDVWRLEFTIKGNQVKFIDKTTGNVNNLSIEFLQDYNNIEQMLYSLQEKYFRFKVITGKSNISRERDVKLFPSKIYNFERFIFHEKGDGTKADKMFIKKLENLNNELRHKYTNIENNVNEIMMEYVTAKGLHDYYLEKINGSVAPEIALYKEKQQSYYENRKLFFQDATKQQIELFYKNTTKSSN